LLRAAQGPAAAKALSCATNRASLNELFGCRQGVRTAQCVAQSGAEEMPAATGLLGARAVDGARGTHDRSCTYFKGVPGNEIMAELFGKETGCRDRGGSMHIFLLTIIL
jgi:TPP-dependent pyruvate/acetoin dehydrogenase alpha subunit